MKYLIILILLSGCATVDRNTRCISTTQQNKYVKKCYYKKDGKYYEYRTESEEIK